MSFLTTLAKLLRPKLMKSHYLCPSCQNPLEIEETKVSVRLWCGNGPCKSVVSNDGARGDTEHEAYCALEDAIEREGKVGKPNNK